VDAIEASRTAAGTAYVAFDGHRTGDYRPHLYRTTDFGKTWTTLSAGLPPNGHVNVVREDPVNHNLLFVGTETGFFVSLDAGKQWTKFMGNLPATISDDVLIHPREHDLVLATHGRSFYVLDDISALEQLTDAVLAENEYLFKPRRAILWDHDRTTYHGGAEDMWRGKNPPDAILSYYMKGPGGAVKIQVADATGAIVRELDGSGDSGIHRVAWDLRTTAGSRIEPGTYAVRLIASGRTYVSMLTVERDPNRSGR
jgi:hypothetical protein